MLLTFEVLPVSGTGSLVHDAFVVGEQDPVVLNDRVSIEVLVAVLGVA